MDVGGGGGGGGEMSVANRCFFPCAAKGKEGEKGTRDWNGGQGGGK